MSKPFDFTVYGYKRVSVVRAYEPFDGAAFIAQSGLDNPRSWYVAHRGTTYLAACPARNTRKAALAIADKLSRECPSAGKVRLKRGEDGVPIHDKIVGPHRKLRSEILAVVDPVRAE